MSRMLADRMRRKAAQERLQNVVGPWRECPKDKMPQWMTRAYANNRYIVMIGDDTSTTHGTAICAMVQRVDDVPILNHWSELQKIKNELFGEEVTAIEYYPAESKLVNDHNIYWLWIFPENIIPHRI